MTDKKPESIEETTSRIPIFFYSPYFVPEEDHWHLKPGAPDDVQKAFDEYMKQDREAEKDGLILD